MTKITKMKKVENTAKTPLTLEEVTKTRDNLVTKVEAKQIELSSAKYGITFDDVKDISRVMKHLDKNTNWTIKDAALVINLHDNLKLEKARIKAEGSEPTANLGAIDLNSLYKSLTTAEGNGIEAARIFITLLTNIGSQISEAMQKMAEANQSIQGMHVELAELDAAVEELSTEKVEADEIIE